MTLHWAAIGSFMHHFSGGVVHVGSPRFGPAQTLLQPDCGLLVSTLNRETATCTTPVVHVVLRCKLLTCTNACPEGECVSSPQENRLHQGVGYVTPDDEHEGRGEAIRKAREAGLEQARLRRLARHRAEREDTTSKGPADVV